MSFHVIHLIIAAMLAGTAVATQVMPGCLERCGAVEIPYPFGVGKGCYLEEKFNITCDSTDEANPTAYMGRGNVSITNILVDSSEVRIMQHIAKDCYTNSSLVDKNKTHRNPKLWLSGFTISSSKNKFFAIGCDTYALVKGYNFAGKSFTTGCISLCYDKDSIINSCSGVGCCQSSFPAALKNRTVTLNSYYRHDYIRDFNPCSYAFIVEEGQFNFSGVSSFGYLDSVKTLPMIVDWWVGNQSCEQAKAAGDVAAHCKGNSTCEDSRSGIGYLCKCLPGYEGNPYHPDGCQDIDECKMESRCNGTCINIPGSYNCTCPKGFELTKNGTIEICRENNRNEESNRSLIIYVPLGISIGVLGLTFLVLMLCLGHKKRKLIRQKEKYFEQNGGLMIQQKLSSAQRGKLFDTKIFSEEELIRATNNYRELLGEGGYGIVYKGTLPDNKVVAVKKPKIRAKQQSKQQIDQFINEVVLLMQINHKNVVRLLGCCLDTEVPILVYEFITNGTLYDHIHKKVSNEPSLSWEKRLKIAGETAGALAYLHSEINTPILHLDIKSMNILLDENYTAKVSDFGASRLASLDESKLSTLVQGTRGYLDPEYFQSNKLTEKSDVYSFGVVLAELITGKKAIYFDESEGITSTLAMSLRLLEDDTELCRAIDKDIVVDEKMEEIKKVVNLAKRCLRITGDNRPTMKEVAIELQGLIRATSNHSWVENVEAFNNEDTEYLLGSPSIEMNHNYNSINNTIVYDSMDNESYNIGR